MLIFVVYLVSELTRDNELKEKKGTIAESVGKHDVVLFLHYIRMFLRMFYSRINTQTVDFKYHAQNCKHSHSVLMQAIKRELKKVSKDQLLYFIDIYLNNFDNNVYLLIAVVHFEKKTIVSSLFQA